MDQKTGASANSSRTNAQPSKSTAQLVIDSLVAVGMDTLYCVPGAQNDAFFDVLWHNQQRLRPIHFRHEQGAAYAAMGAAMATGKPQACCLVPGVGFLNGSAAFVTAYSTNTPVFTLISHAPLPQIGRLYGALHEIPDQSVILRTMTKYSQRIDNASEAPYVMNAALTELMSGRRRPVGVEVPADTWASTSPIDILPPAQPRRAPVDWSLIEKAADLLAKAEHPLIYVGGGAQGASKEIRELAERLQIPVGAIRMGLGVMDARNPLAVPGPIAHDCWAQADVVLAVGTRLANPIRNWGTDSKLKIIRIDADPEEITRFHTPAVSIVGDARDNVAALLEALPTTRKQRDLSKLADLKSAFFARVDKELPDQAGWIKAIRAALPEDGVLVEEMTQVSYASRFAFPVYNPRTYLSSGFQGTLGWGVATAIGAKVAAGSRPVVSVNGDGGFMFTANELSTAVHFKLPIVFIVFADGAYGNVQRTQKTMYKGHVIATDLTNPDFVKFGESFGARAVRAKTPAELSAAITKGLGADGPTLIEVPVGAMNNPLAFNRMARVRGNPT